MRAMEEEDNINRSNQRTEGERNEGVRCRWTPKPEQILILESIFNSGMVNPPKHETVRITNLLQKFGSVADANVFYWFQNRRSRSRRRQRQIQATLINTEQSHETTPTAAAACGAAIQYETGGAMTFPAGSSSSSSSCGMVQNDCSSSDLYSYPPPISHQDFDHNSWAPSVFCTSEINNSHYQPGIITVFINGVATEVPRGPFNMSAIWGQDYVLFHSSGVPISVNEYGFLLESLLHGESYFLVPRQS